MAEIAEQNVVPAGGQPPADEATKQRVRQWHARIAAAKKHDEAAFKRMRQDMEYARLGASEAWVEGENYVVPIIKRHVNQEVAKIYARNPRAVAKRRPRLDYVLWDGRMESLQAAMAAQQQAMEATAQTGVPVPVDPNAAALLQEVAQVQQQHMLLDRMAKTQEILFHYYLGEQDVSFVAQMKQLVRRVKTCGVGYLKLGFQRIFEPNADISAKIRDVTAQLARARRLVAEAQEGEVQVDDAEMNELATMLRDLQEQEMMIVREGPVFEFPRATEIIIDPRCRQIKGFIGAGWIAHERFMSPAEIRETYNVDIGTAYKTYKPDSAARVTAPYAGETPPADKTDGLCCRWEVWDRETGQTFVVVDGYDDFVAPPAPPKGRLERFWPVFVLTFNDIEHETERYPASDVHDLKAPQDEYNRAKQGLREHRWANRPKYLAAKGQFEDADKTNLMAAPPHSVFEVKALQVGQKATDLVQPFPSQPIDPNLYETATTFDDVLKTVGTQQAHIGGLAKGTATESSIAESHSQTDLSSNIDDLDLFLSDFARSVGQLLLLEVSAETAKRIAGPGAVWPEQTRQEVAEELFLEIKAGSSGQPNRAAELANLERGMPFLIQMPGINPGVLSRRYGDLLDLDMEEMIAEGLPSIVAMNAAAGKVVQPGTGDGSDPKEQGDKGRQNAPQGDNERNAPPGQPAYPAP